MKLVFFFKNRKADAIIAGKEYTTRDIILSAKNIIGTSSTTFSGMIYQTGKDEEYIITYVITCKNPTARQLYDIILNTHKTTQKLLKNTPKIAIIYCAFLMIQSP